MKDVSQKTLNVLFSSDDHYAQHLGAAVYSLLDNNKEFGSVCIYVIDNAVSVQSKAYISCVAASFSNAEIVWIPFDEWKKQLKLNMAWEISVSAYARLFVASMLPKSVDRVLYLDCDMIVCGSLAELWSTDLQGNVIGAVQDTVRDSTKTAVGLQPAEPYFNSGLLLIDLDAWRKNSTQTQCVEFICRHKGNVVHHDQGTLNGVLKNSWCRLPLQNNLMTIHTIFTFEKVARYFKDHSPFYAAQEIEKAKRAPVILHYTPSFTSRPWVKNCKHPKRQLYWQAVAQTPWKGAKPEQDNSKWYVKLINWRYRNLPFYIKWNKK